MKRFAYRAGLGIWLYTVTSLLAYIYGDILFESKVRSFAVKLLFNLLRTFAAWYTSIYIYNQNLQFPQMSIKADSLPNERFV